ncbi:MAG: lysylphosphatidylglycerol synthase transmembrane domain-containing protein [Balneolaceae bacterium]
MCIAEEHSAGQQPLISYKYLFISVGLSLLGMAAVIYMTYSPGVLEHLRLKRMPGLIIAIGVTFLRLWFSAAKIRFLAENRVSWIASVRITLSWEFASAVTPSTIGGAPVATYAMSREGIKLGKSTGIMLYAVLLDQFWYAIAVPILLVAGVYMEVIPPEIGLLGAATMGLIYTGLIAYGVFLTYGLLVNPRTMKKIVVGLFRLPFLRRYSEKVNEEAEHLEEYSYDLRKKPLKFILTAFFLSTMSWLCKVALPPIVVLSLLPAQEVLMVMRSLAMNLAFLVIPTPGGSGGVEGLFALFLGPLITRTAFIGLAVFVWRVITYYISIGLGIMAVTWYINHTVGDISTASETPASNLNEPQKVE